MIYLKRRPLSPVADKTRREGPAPAERRSFASAIRSSGINLNSRIILNKSYEMASFR